MRPILFGTCLVLLLTTGHAVAADPIALTKGRLIHSGNYAVQTVGAVNNTGSVISFIEVECGFFARGTLIRSGQGNTQNIGAGQKAYFDVVSPDASDADSADCRVVSVH